MAFNFLTSSNLDDEELHYQLARENLGDWSRLLRRQIKAVWDNHPHGLLESWINEVNAMPRPHPSSIDFQSDCVRIGAKEDCTLADRDEIEQRFQKLAPWRKGPFEIFGVSVDAEWRSDWKWSRLESHIEPLAGRRVLDIGCGNGYYAWRMVGAGARLVIGIDPNQLFNLQFLAIRSYLPNPPHAWTLPIGVDDLPDQLNFDTLFCMGILYHRKTPIELLLKLRSWMRPAGQLVLETLVIPGDERSVLVPEGRYAKMANCWFIPSVAALKLWMRRCGFTQIEVISQSITTVEEQRSTSWMRFESLADFLDPADNGKTIEGYPRPMRAILLASRTK